MISIVFLISVFLAGILSFFSPCILPLLPVYVGILLDTDEPRTITIFGKKIAWYGIIKTLCFIAGLSIVFLILGYGAGFLGKVLYTEWFRYVLGAIVVFLGVHQMELINFKLLQRQKSVQLKKDKNRNDFYNAFLLGVIFSFGWTPCIGPVLSSVLALAASGGNGAWQGAIYTLIYTLGMAIPFLLLALASGVVMPYFSKIKRHMMLLKKIGGFLIILMGILLLLGQVNVLAGIFE